MTSHNLELLVWHESQRVPATVYGKAHAGDGNFTIKVCPTREAIDAARAASPSAIVYHFNANLNGGGHGR